MSSGNARPRKEQSLSKVLVEGFPDPGTFENIPRVAKIAPESNLPYVAVAQWIEELELTWIKAHAG
jgi:hypothetical protein